MFTDVAGASRLMGDDEDLVMTLIRRDLRIIRELCRQYEGRVLKSMGDGLLAVFESGVHAVGCAQDIQRHFAEQAGSLPSERVLEHRIGIHLGDVYVSDRDAMGDGVNIAARLQSEAPPGGICISKPLYEVVRKRLSLKTEYRGPRSLKNIEDEVHLYDIVEFPDEPGRKPVPVEVAGAGWKRYAYWGLGAACLLAAGLLVVPGLGGSGSESASGEPTPEEFALLDTDGDMELSYDELPELSRDRIMRADTDADGVITPEEFNERMELVARREEYLQDLFTMLDTDDDGCISCDELPEHMRDRIMQADLNGDDIVSALEFENTVDRLQLEGGGGRQE